MGGRLVLVVGLVRGVWVAEGEGEERGVCVDTGVSRMKMIVISTVVWDVVVQKASTQVDAIV